MKAFYFKEWMDKVAPNTMNHYFGRGAQGAASTAVDGIGKVLRVLQQHTNNLQKILHHHNDRLGHKHAGWVGGYSSSPRLNDIDGAMGSESEAVKQVISGYRVMKPLIDNLEKVSATEQDRDVKLFAQELVKAVRESQQIAGMLRGGNIDEKTFGMLKSDHARLIRLVQEAKNFMAQHDDEFHNTFSAQQQHPDTGSSSWRNGPDVVDLGQKR